MAKQSGWKGPKPPFASACEDRVLVEMAAVSNSAGLSPSAQALCAKTNRCLSIPFPVIASRVTLVWLRTAARISAALRWGEARVSRKASVKALDSGVADRIVSVLPCLKAAVEALSYVETVRPRSLAMASWNDICIIPSGDTPPRLSELVVKSSRITVASCVPRMVASNRDPASATAPASGGGSTKRSSPGGDAAGAAGSVVGMAIEWSKISFAKRSTATPSPHECSKLMAALALAVTMSWNDLSSQRSVPLP
eukprot:scaffold4156_cov101-Isochrysis_galbana.AAC.4